MKITIELSEEDIRNGRLSQLEELWGRPNIVSTEPREEEPLPSLGMFQKDQSKEDPDSKDLMLSMGEGLMRELVALWLDEELHSIDRAAEIQQLALTPHTQRAVLAFVKHFKTLPHAVDYVRIKWGGEPGDWQKTESIALNITQIASISGFPQLSDLYHETFKWESADPNYKLYRSQNA